MTIKTGTSVIFNRFIIEGPKGRAEESVFINNKDSYFLSVTPDSAEWYNRYSLETALEFCATGRITGKPHDG